MGQLVTVHPVNAHAIPVLGDGWVISELLANPCWRSVTNHRWDGIRMVVRWKKCEPLPTRFEPSLATKLQSEVASTQLEIWTEWGSGHVFDNPGFFGLFKQEARWCNKVWIDHPCISLRFCCLAVCLTRRTGMDHIVLMSIFRHVLQCIRLNEPVRVSWHRPVIHPRHVEPGAMVAFTCPASPAKEIEQSWSRHVILPKTGREVIPAPSSCGATPPRHHRTGRRPFREGFPGAHDES